VVHDVSVEVEDDDVSSMIDTYEASGEKEWIAADVTIDGTTFRDAGMRLKGNSSLRSVGAESEPADLPWLIELDQFVDGQSLDGWDSFVVRSSSTEPALNEAVALELLGDAGLASQSAIAGRFSVNGSEERLRLLVQDLDRTWDEATFGTAGTLYKSEAGGDWSYRGADATAYEDVFDIEAGTEDYAPLTDFLKWLDEASDEEFAEELEDRLDVEAFADYLAFEDLVGNFDDIEGPGNNSFLRWDADAQRMTVVAWDHNLAFGAMAGMERGGGGPGGQPPESFEPPADGEIPEGFEPPAEGELPEGFEPPAGGGGSPMGRGNVLVDRFEEVPEFQALYEESLERLQAELFDSGAAEDVLQDWVEVLTEQASDIVSEKTIRQEAADVRSYFDGHAAEEAPSAAPG
jgi:spore coat protein CotH